MTNLVKVGDWLISNDPAAKHPTVKVCAVYVEPRNGKTFACYRTSERGRINKIDISRLNNSRMNSWTVAPSTV